MRYINCPRCGLTLPSGGPYGTGDHCPHCREDGAQIPLRPTPRRFSRDDAVAALGYSLAAASTSPRAATGKRS